MDKEKGFMIYDYTVMIVKKDMESIYIDTYENLGWEITDYELITHPSSVTSPKIKLYFRRNRKIDNKAELNQLQNKIDVCISNIDKLKKQKTAIASIKSISIGLFAMLFLALSVFIITDYIPISIAFAIFFGAIGILSCIPPYFVYKSTVAKKTEEIEPLIDQEYDNISDLCEEGHRIIYH